MKKITALVSALALLLSFAACGAQNSTSASQGETEVKPSAASHAELTEEKQSSEISVHDIRKADTKIYDFCAESSDFQIYFVNGADDIPYIEVSQLAELMNKAAVMLDDTNFSIAVSVEDNTATLTRETGYFAEINFDTGEIYFVDYNAFFTYSTAFSIIDSSIGVSTDADGNYQYVSATENTFERYGREITIELSNYDIYLAVSEDGASHYIPLSTCSDIFFSPSGISLAYNGENVFEIPGGQLPDEAESVYYSVAPKDRSEELAMFSYNELCLAMDMFYGLKDEHNITSFNLFFDETGQNVDLQDTDPQISDAALAELTMGYLSDLHSALVSPSPYSGYDFNPYGSTHYGYSALKSDTDMNIYSVKRDEAFPKGWPAYQEVGNTAFITFDMFLGNTEDYYGGAEINPDNDTIALVIYANKQIQRANSPIKNVVIDLSNNSGGSTQAAIYLLSWLTGNCYINISDSFTGAQVATNYVADTNLDSNFDENDNISDKNIFCLISPNSFSCGNLVPAMLKSSGKATLLGNTSGGGTCIVYYLATADGALLQISSPYRLSTISNGSFYNVDQGVEPDFKIVHTENYYNRKALSSYINSLF